jgi:uncharacterized protein (DUF362 family)
MDTRDIIMIYGADPEIMTLRLLQESDIANMVSPSSRIVLKPNLVVPSDASEGATTHPQIVEACIRYFKSMGCNNIAIVESAWVGASTEDGFKAHGYNSFVQKYKVDLIDVKRDSYTKISAHGYEIEVSDTILAADILINLPVLKGHCQTTMTCALKNMKGCISDLSKRKFHSWGLHEPIAVLNTIRCADLVLVDSLNGDLDFEEGGNPVQTNRMFVGRDSVLVDTYAANLMGFESEEVEYIDIARQLGVGSADIESARIIELNADVAIPMPRPSHRVQSLATHTIASSACSACYGNLIHALARLQERGTLDELGRKVHIGQDYKGKSGCGIGVGICTKGFNQSLPGCPPKALDMVKFLEKLAQED